MRVNVDIDYYSGVRRPLGSSLLTVLTGPKFPRKGRFLRPKYFFVFFAGLCGLALVLLFALKSHANVATFYPTSCLGGWGNTHLAEGPPETQTGVAFSVENSALLKSGTAAQIFCSSFNYDVHEKVVPTHLTLRLALATLQEITQNASGTSESSGPTVFSENQATDTVTGGAASEVLGTSTPSNSVGDSSHEDASSSDSAAPLPSTLELTPPPPPAESPITPHTSDTPPSDTSTPAPTPTPADTSPSSFLNFLIGTAFATTSETASDASTSDSTLPDITSETTTLGVGDVVPLSLFDATATAAPQTQVASVAATLIPSIEPFLEVSVTIDGVNWQTLGVLSPEDFQNAHFEIPLPPNFDWAGLGTIEVAVRNITTPSTPPSVLLDGMALEVTYEALPEQTPQLQKGEVRIPHVKTIMNGARVSATTTDNGGGQLLVIRGVSGTGLRFYDLHDPSFSIVIGVGDDPVSMPVSFFHEGDLVAVDTGADNTCAALTIAECRADPGYVGEASVSIIGVVSSSTEQ